MAEQYMMKLAKTCTIDLRGLDLSSPILDVGGGGEGIISRALPDAFVIAIDRLEEELLESQGGGVKLVMDAGKMSFIDGCFSSVTLFFSLMYMDGTTRRRVLQECRRVLKPGGTLHIWDAVIPKKREGDQEVYAVPLTVLLDSQKVSTTYGVRWSGHELSGTSIIELCEQEGLRLLTADDFSRSFYVCCRT